MKMKHGFTLIEAMIAIVVIFVGFGAIIAMGLSATSNANSSKAKLRATDLATGILEGYRAGRDANGVANLYLTPAPTPISIEGVTYGQTVTVYKLDTNSVIVEAKVDWTIKNYDKVINRIYLTNNSSRFATVAAPFTTPIWYIAPTAVPTSTPTPTPTPTPPTCYSQGGLCFPLPWTCMNPLPIQVTANDCPICCTP